jgi:F-type H+-transporting ATPase subunit delta
MRNTRVARRYAQALMLVAEESGAEEATVADLTIVDQVVRSSKEFRAFLRSPVITVPKKKAVVRSLFGKRVSKLTMSFLDLLVNKQREVLIPEIVEQFLALRDEMMGIVNADVTSAVDLTKPQQKSIARKLEEQTGKQVRTNFAVNPTLRGGLVVRIGDTVHDGSLAHQLKVLRDRFAEGGPHTN